MEGRVIRVHLSSATDRFDVEMRIDLARRLLCDGHEVRLSHVVEPDDPEGRHLVDRLIASVIEALSDVALPGSTPSVADDEITVLMRPFA